MCVTRANNKFCKDCQLPSSNAPRSATQTHSRQSSLDFIFNKFVQICNESLGQDRRRRALFTHWPMDCENVGFVILQYLDCEETALFNRIGLVLLFHHQLILNSSTTKTRSIGKWVNSHPSICTTYVINSNKTATLINRIAGRRVEHTNWIKSLFVLPVANKSGWRSASSLPCEPSVQRAK